MTHHQIIFLSWEFSWVSIWFWKKDQSCPVKLILTWHTCLWLLKFDLLTFDVFIAFHCSSRCTRMDCILLRKLIISIPAEYLKCERDLVFLHGPLVHCSLCVSYILLFWQRTGQWETGHRRDSGMSFADFSIAGVCKRSQIRKDFKHYCIWASNFFLNSVTRVWDALPNVPGLSYKKH